MVNYKGGDRARVMRLVRKISSEVKFYVEPNEAYQIYMAAKRSGKVKGDLAEVGVYKGGSAKVICEAKGNRRLYLFDTFEGLPPLSSEDTKGYFHEGEFRSYLIKVQRYLKKYPFMDVYNEQTVYKNGDYRIYKETNDHFVHTFKNIVIAHFF